MVVWVLCCVVLLFIMSNVGLSFIVFSLFCSVVFQPISVNICYNILFYNI